MPLSQVGEASHIALDRVVGWLAEESRAHGVAIHGWALTGDCLVLLATPAAADSLPRLMQALGRRLAAHVRVGRVFAGRYRSTLVEPGAWVVPSLAWLEALPLRQALTGDLERWAWSSAPAHMGAGSCAFLTDHADYWAYGNTPFDRQAGYRQYLLEGLGQMQSSRIERALHGQWALGSPEFLKTLEQGSVSRRPAAAKRGRPRKVDPSLI